MGKGSRRGIVIVGSGFGELVVGAAGMRMGRPAREARIWDGPLVLEVWRWVPGPGA